MLKCRFFPFYVSRSILRNSHSCVLGDMPSLARWWQSSKQENQVTLQYTGEPLALVIQPPHYSLLLIACLCTGTLTCALDKANVETNYYNYIDLRLSWRTQSLITEAAACRPAKPFPFSMIFLNTGLTVFLVKSVFNCFQNLI